MIDFSYLKYWEGMVYNSVQLLYYLITNLYRFYQIFSISDNYTSLCTPKNTCKTFTWPWLLFATKCHKKSDKNY